MDLSLAERISPAAPLIKAPLIIRPVRWLSDLIVAFFIRLTTSEMTLKSLSKRDVKKLSLTTLHLLTDKQFLVLDLTKLSRKQTHHLSNARKALIKRKDKTDDLKRHLTYKELMKRGLAKVKADDLSSRQLLSLIAAEKGTELFDTLHAETWIRTAAKASKLREYFTKKEFEQTLTFLRSKAPSTVKAHIRALSLLDKKNLHTLDALLSLDTPYTEEIRTKASWESSFFLYPTLHADQKLHEGETSGEREKELIFTHLPHTRFQEVFSFDSFSLSTQRQLLKQGATAKNNSHLSANLIHFLLDETFLIRKEILSPEAIPFILRHSDHRDVSDVIAFSTKTLTPYFRNGKGNESWLINALIQSKDSKWIAQIAKLNPKFFQQEAYLLERATPEFIDALWSRHQPSRIHIVAHFRQNPPTTLLTNQNAIRQAIQADQEQTGLTSPETVLALNEITATTPLDNTLLELLKKGIEYELIDTIQAVWEKTDLTPLYQQNRSDLKALEPIYKIHLKQHFKTQIEQQIRIWGPPDFELITNALEYDLVTETEAYCQSRGISEDMFVARGSVPEKLKPYYLKPKLEAALATNLYQGTYLDILMLMNDGMKYGLKNLVESLYTHYDLSLHRLSQIGLTQIPPHLIDFYKRKTICEVVKGNQTNLAFFKSYLAPYQDELNYIKKSNEEQLIITHIGSLIRYKENPTKNRNPDSDKEMFTSTTWNYLQSLKNEDSNSLRTIMRQRIDNLSPKPQPSERLRALMTLFPEKPHDLKELLSFDSDQWAAWKAFNWVPALNQSHLIMDVETFIPQLKIPLVNASSPATLPLPNDASKAEMIINTFNTVSPKLNQTHLRIALSKVPRPAAIPPAPTDVTPNDFMPLFDRYANAPQLRHKMQALANNVARHKADLPNLFKQAMHVIKFLKQEQDPEVIRSQLRLLAEHGDYCAQGYATDVMLVSYLTLSKQLDTLEQFRGWKSFIPHMAQEQLKGSVESIAAKITVQSTHAVLHGMQELIKANFPIPENFGRRDLDAAGFQHHGVAPWNQRGGFWPVFGPVYIYQLIERIVFEGNARLKQHPETLEELFNEFTSHLEKEFRKECQDIMNTSREKITAETDLDKCQTLHKQCKAKIDA
ncbi:MAG: hypothetical protein KDK65_02665, partial [Chlamydiia bacterium]|nr:hypothetical protein [Chlamydiia bacterium]